MGTSIRIIVEQSVSGAAVRHEITAEFGNNEEYVNGGAVLKDMTTALLALLRPTPTDDDKEPPSAATD